MKFKFTLFAGLFSVCSLFVPAVNSSESVAPQACFLIDCEHTFVKVYENGRWWLYEYDCDGSLINVIPIDE